jgi:hypothetical protein
MPLLLIQLAWLYWLLAALCFIGLYAIAEGLNRLSYELWIKRTSSVKERGYVFGPYRNSVPAMVFLLLTLLVYAVVTYIGQVGYVFAWYAILVAIDVFLSPSNLVQLDPNGETRSVPHAVQFELLHIDLVMDAVIAALAVGATYLFLNAVVLA